MNRTLALIKPDAVDRNIIGEIITLIEQNGFIVRNMKFMKMSQSIAERFYEAHKEKPFYDKLVTYILMQDMTHLIRQLMTKMTT